ncbi:MAG: NAD-dependent epimerase/dehydratase family protein [Rhodobacteraceae bacterium]|nr:NAD-dependent epimerase/dehydratase family protein [Paracoccaceae bacterium]
MTQTALILGASGKIGRHFTNAFRAAGWQTRAYVRGTDMSAAARGCDVIVNGMNPPAYHDWQTILPQITAQVIGAAKASGATILFPGNVYVYGTQPGPWSADTPHKPCSRKGTVRAAIEGQYRAAAAKGVQTILLRAGDFLAPELGDSHVDMIYLRAYSKGVITTMGDPDVERAHAWLPDMARAAVMLAQKRADLPAFSDIPFPGLTFSTAQLARGLERLTGRNLTVKPFPWWLFGVAAPVWELAREMKEMRYLFNTPHRLSPEALAQILPDFQPAPFERVLAEILDQRTPRAAAA